MGDEVSLISSFSFYGATAHYSNLERHGYFYGEKEKGRYGITFL